MPTPKWQLYVWGLQLTWLLFVFAFGACIGSLINVLVYRLPRGIGVVTPPSRCTSCGTRLTFRENLPILGWLLLRGRCRYCRAPVSAEYPLVEAFVAVLFAFFFVLWFMVPPEFTWLGVRWGAIRPEWAHPQNPLAATVPLFLLLLFLLGSLVATTLVDAKTFTIPLVLTWVPAALALLVHVGVALYVQRTAGRLYYTAPDHIWAIPTPVEVVSRQWFAGWKWIAASIGGVVGLAAGLALLATGLIGRSFADYPDWERSIQPPDPVTTPPRIGAAASDAAPSSAPPDGPDRHDAVAASGAADAQENPSEERAADVWIQYPHARREMIRELAFLAPCAAFALAGYYLGASWRQYPPPPLWLAVLGGVLMGYLIGGGVVWAVRITGSFAFGKEAMGLGDVHLMAAVGACLGWIDATIAFFLASFVGVGLTLATMLVGRGARRTMPYGPSLAIASVLVVLCKPLIESFLSRLTGSPVNLP